VVMVEPPTFSIRFLEVPMPALRNAVVVAALCVLSIALYQTVRSAPATARAASAPRSTMPAFLRFGGTGRSSIRPDLVDVQFQVTGTGSTLIAATDQANSTMDLLIGLARHDGVARADTQTGQLFGSCDDRTGRCTAGQSLSVTVRKTSITGRLLASGIKLGAQASYQPAYSYWDQRAGEAAALRSAVTDARAKAVVAAAAAGVHLGTVVSVSESSQPVYPFGYNNLTAAYGGLAASAVVPVRLGRQVDSESVTVVFSYVAG